MPMRDTRAKSSSAPCGLRELVNRVFVLAALALPLLLAACQPGSGGPAY
jgi:hypothetical protein